VHRLRVAPGAPADGVTIAEVAERVGQDMWVSIVVRDSLLVAVSDDIRLRAGDEVVVLADADVRDDRVATFDTPR